MTIDNCTLAEQYMYITVTTHLMNVTQKEKVVKSFPSENVKILQYTCVSKVAVAFVCCNAKRPMKEPYGKRMHNTGEYPSHGNVYS